MEMFEIDLLGLVATLSEFCLFSNINRIQLIQQNWLNSAYSATLAKFSLFSNIEQIQLIQQY